METQQTLIHNIESLGSSFLQTFPKSTEVLSHFLNDEHIASPSLSLAGWQQWHNLSRQWELGLKAIWNNCVVEETGLISKMEVQMAWCTQTQSFCLFHTEESSCFTGVWQLITVELQHHLKKVWNLFGACLLRQASPKLKPGTQYSW